MIRRKIIESKIKIAAEVAIALARKTPVATSRAQSNWGLSAASSFAYYPYPPYPYYPWGYQTGPTYQLVAAQVREQQRRLVNEIPEMATEANVRSPVYVGNMTPYLRYLARGKSTQAPAGWIKETAMQKYRELANQLDFGDVIKIRT